MRNCNYCNEKMTNAVHERWCKFNPNLKKNKKQQSEKVSVGASARTKTAWVTGKMDNISYSNKGHPHSEATKLILREKALASNHRRLVRSIREYVKKDGSIVMLDSSWEELLAKRLDSLDIDWIRPKPIKWIDSKGQSRNYFPDFYLPKYDLLLDPKNPEAMRQQFEKVSWLKENVKKLIFLHSEEEIKTFLP